MSNTHIRLASVGFANFTGTFGGVEFKDGLSTRACIAREIDLLASITRVEAETGEAVGLQERLIGGATISAPILEALPTQTKGQKLVEEANRPVELPPATTVQERHYTRDELENVADADGIAGLRKIADPRGLKGTSITKLMASILDDQEARHTKGEHTMPTNPNFSEPTNPHDYDNQDPTLMSEATRHQRFGMSNVNPADPASVPVKVVKVDPAENAREALDPNRKVTTPYEQAVDPKDADKILHPDVSNNEQMTAGGGGETATTRETAKDA